MFKKSKNKKKNDILNRDIVKKILSGEKSLDSVSLQDIQKYKNNFKILSNVYACTIFVWVIIMLKNPFAFGPILFYSKVFMDNFKECRNTKYLEKAYIEYLEMKKEKTKMANINNNFQEKAYSLTRVCSVRPYEINNSLEQQGYSKVENSRPSSSSALNPNYWISSGEEQPKRLTR